MSSFRTSRFALVVAALTAFAACSDDDDPSGPSTGTVDAETELRRLLVADATQSQAYVVNLKDNTRLATYTLAAPASLVYASHSGRFGVVHQRTADRVSFVDGGVWTEGSGAQATATRQPPSMLAFELRDQLPTHENVNGPWISVFFDGTGMARYVDERELAAGNPRVAVEFSSGGGQHSGSASLTTSAGDFFVYAPLNPAGGLPTSVAVRSRQGQEVGRTDACPSMHGNGATRQAVVFGCEDGMVLIRPGSGTPTVTKITPSGDLAGLGVRTVWGEYDTDFLVGRLQSRAGVTPTRRVLATIAPASGALNTLALPAGVTDHWVAVDAHGQLVIVLGTNGNLYIFDGVTRTLRRTVAGVVPALPATGAQTHQIAVAEGSAWVASPSTGEIVRVNTSTGALGGRIAVGGAPSRLTLLGVASTGTYRLASN